jgi:hypothetical protein
MALPPLKLINKWINFGGAGFFHGLPFASTKEKITIQKILFKWQEKYSHGL